MVTRAPHAISWIVPWNAMSICLFLAQLLLGTSASVAFFSLLIFLIFPFVIKAYLKIDSIGVLILVSNFTKLFLVSQILKVLYLQAADTYIEKPFLTFFFLFLGLIGFWLASFIIRPIVGNRGGLFKASNHPQFLLQLAVGATVLCLIAVLVRHWLGIDWVGTGQYEQGQGLVVILFLGQLMPLAVAALTARVAILSNGRRFIDRLVIGAILLTAAQGLWENQRTIMFAGAVAFVATYLSYGGRPRIRHVALICVGGLLMQFLIFPLIDLQRGFSYTITTDQFLETTGTLTADMFDTSKREAHEDYLNALYENWYTRLYYGEPKGFIDRFAPNLLDETITHYEVITPPGLSQLAGQALYGIPSILLQPLEISRPIRGSEMMEMDIFGRYTYLNYGIFAEIYASIDRALYLPASTIIIALYIIALHLLYGNFKNNYFSAFGFSTCYFNFATADLADLISKLTVQGTMNLFILMGFTLLFSRHGLSASPFIDRRAKP